MLKVVGASWLQTRISTYILVAVALLGIGAFLLGEFGSDEKDGTYSATVFWNHKGGYRIDFWGQGNDLVTLPRGAARAYYKTRIQETGWSIVEIETSASYPDTVQAYAAGLLEGSLTWQLIHHHWYNTIGTICSVEENENICSTIRQKLRENAAVIRERSNLLASEDPYWHMVRLFYAQLDGMEAGWRFAVRRSRRSVDIMPEDFLWLAMASEVPEKLFKIKSNSVPPSTISINDLPNVSSIKSSNDEANNNGVIFVKSLNRTNEELEPLVAISQNTVAPYAKMLRLLKRYTFGYHLAGGRHSPRAPTRSIFMSSYPGALSSHDEYYIIRGGKEKDDILILAAIPLREASRGSEQIEDEKDEEGESILNIQGVMSPVRIMSANRLSTEPRSWSKLLARGNPSELTLKATSKSLQWITLKPKDTTIWLIEQRSSIIRAIDRTENFAKNGFVYCDGESILEKEQQQLANDDPSNKNLIVELHQSPAASISEMDRFFMENITSVGAIRNLMRGNAKYFDEEIIDQDRSNITSSSSANKNNNTLESMNLRLSFGHDLLGKFVYRADLEISRLPMGTIDNKMALTTVNGIESFEATSGPPYGHEMANSLTLPFDWTISYFANFSRIGQPEKFEFDSVIPEWVWF